MDAGHKIPALETDGWQNRLWGAWLNRFNMWEGHESCLYVLLLRKTHFLPLTLMEGIHLSMSLMMSLAIWLALAKRMRGNWWYTGSVHRPKEDSHFLACSLVLLPLPQESQHPSPGVRWVMWANPSCPSHSARLAAPSWPIELPSPAQPILANPLLTQIHELNKCLVTWCWSFMDIIIQHDYGHS